MSGLSDYSHQRLPSGLRVVTAPMPSSRSVTVMVMAAAGSRYEDRRLNGLSHFMEHMFFKGAQRYPDARAVATALDTVGGVFNAFTAEEKVAYFVKLSAAKKEIGYDVLSDMLLASKFDAEEIDRERGVIIEEIRMYNDDPGSRVQLDFKRHFYGDQPIGWDIAGPEENITNFSREDFVAFRDSRYTAGSCVLVAAGDITPEENRRLAEQYFTFAPQGAAAGPAPYLPVEGIRATLRTRDIEQAHLVLGFPMPGERDPIQPALKVINTIFGGVMSSRLFHHIRERRGLAYYVRSYRSTYSDTGAIKIGAGVNTSKATEAIAAIMEQIGLLAEKGITTDEFEKGKANIEGRLDLSTEDSMSVANLFGGQELLYGSIKTPDDLVAEINALTLDEVNTAAATYFDRAKTKLAMLGPFDDLAPFEAAMG